MAWLKAAAPQPAPFGPTPQATGKIWRTVLEYAAYFQHHTYAISDAVIYKKMEEMAEEVKVATKAVGEELANYEETLAKAPGWSTAMTADDLVAYFRRCYISTSRISTKVAICKLFLQQAGGTDCQAPCLPLQETAGGLSLLGGRMRLVTPEASAAHSTQRTQPPGPSPHDRYRVALSVPQSRTSGPN